MKHINNWESFNESKFYNKDILPKEAQEELMDYLNTENDKIEVYPDPKVEGCYAVRVYRDDLTFDLLWYKGGFDDGISSDENEHGFSTWPPTSGDLKFFF
jgi:hypothetical protein